MEDERVADVPGGNSVVDAVAFEVEGRSASSGATSGASEAAEGAEGAEGAREVEGRSASSDATSGVSEAAEGAEDAREASPLLMCLLCCISALEGADIALLPAVLKALQIDLGLSLTDTGIIATFQGLFQALSAPFWGVLADRGILTRKTILVVGSVCQGAVTCVLASVNDLVPIILLRCLNGAMLASLRPVGNGVLADVTCEARRGKVYGWIFFAVSIGMMGGNLLGTPISNQIIMGFQGWRVAFVIIGFLSVFVGLMVAVCMTEPEREGAKLKRMEEGPFSEVKRLWGYLRTPTFLALVVQGCFGVIPWNALGYRTLFLQVSGLGDTATAVVQAASLVASAFGALLGGVLADCVVRRSLPLHGRPFVAQASVLLGIPITWLTFMVEVPPGTGAFWYYLVMVCLFGLTATWCATGVNLPILSEIVPADNRSAIIAWQTALEQAFAAILANVLVTVLAEEVFGYVLPKPGQEVEEGPRAQKALGKALTHVVIIPFAICLGFYSLLHWTYPRDRARALAAKAAREAPGCRVEELSEPNDTSEAVQNAR